MFIMFSTWVFVKSFIKTFIMFNIDVSFATFSTAKELVAAAIRKALTSFPTRNKRKITGVTSEESVLTAMASTFGGIFTWELLAFSAGSECDKTWGVDSFVLAVLPRLR